MVQLLEFGPDAKAYIRLQLSKQETLWRALCDLPLEMGRVFAWLPPHVSLWDLLHFAWHINKRIDSEAGTIDYEYREKQNSYIATHLGESSNKLAIFRGTPSPPLKEIRNLTGPVSTYRLTRRFPNTYSDEVPTITEIHHIIKAPVTREEVDSALAGPLEGMPFTGVLTSLPPDHPGLPEERELDYSFIQLLVRRAEAILVGAYGDDAVLIWTRAGSIV